MLGLKKKCLRCLKKSSQMLWSGTVEMSVSCYWEFYSKSWVVKQPQRDGKVNLGWWDLDGQEPGWWTEYIFEIRRIGRRFWNFPKTSVLRTCRGLILHSLSHRPSLVPMVLGIEPKPLLMCVKCPTAEPHTPFWNLCCMLVLTLCWLIRFPEAPGGS